MQTENVVNNTTEESLDQIKVPKMIETLILQIVCCYVPFAVLTKELEGTKPDALRIKESIQKQLITM